MEKQEEGEQLFLIPLIEVHCFFGCPYVAESVEPQEAHDLMEQHYTQVHAWQIERIIKWLG